jgi:hypothetical protein
MSLTGNQALQPEIGIHNEQLFDLVPMEPLARLVERRADRHGDPDCLFVITSAIGRSTRVSNRKSRFVRMPTEPAFLVAVFGDRHAADPVALHQFQRFVECGDSATA